MRLLPIVLLAFSVSVWSADTPATKNVVIILVDDFGYECVTANGGESYKTPNVDALAAGGMRYECGYATPLCTPTRMQLMTGQYNIRNYVDVGEVDMKQQTFGHWFRDAGYTTGIFGKWQLGSDYDRPKHFGFDTSYLWQLVRRPARYVNPGLETNHMNLDFSQGEYGPDLVNEQVCQFITANKDKSFFAYYPMMLTHDPYEPTPDSPEYKKDATGSENNKSRVVNVKHFADMVGYMDKMVGNVITTLEKNNLRKNTLIVFLGDNGTGTKVTSQFKGQPYKGGKGSTIERGMHVPFIINQPGTVNVGVSTDLIDTTDIVPTILDATGTKRPDWTLDGVSQWPALTGKSYTKRDWIYCWYAPRMDKPDEFVRGPTLKLKRDGRIFDMLTDLEEKKPLMAAQVPENRRAELVILQAGLAQYANARPAWAEAAIAAQRKAGGKNKKNPGDEN